MPRIRAVSIVSSEPYFDILDLAQRAIAVVKVERDAARAGDARGSRPRKGAREPDQAIALLQKLLAIPCEGPMNGEQMPLTSAMPKLDPMFDSLRKDLRFQKLTTNGESALKAQAKP